MKLNKNALASRTEKAAASTPGIAERLAHAQSLVNAHPTHVVPSVPPDSEPIVAISPTTSTRFIAAPLDLIDVNPYNARRVYRPERVSELAASIGAKGQDVPGIATERNGRYVLAAGHYRLRAKKVLGHPTMDLMVHPNLTDKELYEYSFRENAERETQNAFDNALAWRDLLTLGLYATETELAEVTGLSLPTINKTLRILTLSEPVLDVVREDPAAFALTALYELALLEPLATPDETLDFARKVRNGDAGRKELQEARAKLEHPKTRKTKETSRQYKISMHGSPVGIVKSWDSGRIALDIRITDPSERNKILEQLKEQFGITE